MPKRPAGLRVGLIGAGYVAPFHLRAWAQVEGAEVVAVADPDQERASACAQAFGIGQVFADPAAMLDAVGPDALDIASPRQCHVAHIDLAIAEGLPALCQKSLAPTLAEAEDVTARAHGKIRLMVHENWRFRHLYRHLGQRLTEHGGLRSCRIVMRTRALLADDAGLRPAIQRQPFMGQERRLALAEMLIHHLDAARYLCGELTLRQCWLQRNEPDLIGETAAHLVLEAASGFPVIVTGDMTAAGAPPGAADWVELIGQGWRIETHNGDVRRYAGEHLVEERRFPPTDDLQHGFDGAICHFARALRDDRPFETSAADNLQTLRLVEQAYAAAAHRGAQA